ncbi:hypothetical protein LTR64_006749 [Lithohypha guttulata]|uniref:uncharacterized protein n=1 Tax=Lithohypha guttulata TaxID=1690604 RepID=UPI002DDDC350|nr:hypothetical protein LTR51_004692 [Lithohypha guttulata]
MGGEGNSHKRPGSPPGDLSMPPAKMSKSGHLQINYLKREKKEVIPLATPEEPMPRLIRLLQEYDAVLQRHESLAGNLGACPVGPILLKRFERLFEGPPRILKSNSRDPNISWLDVVEFAQNKPEQFDLEKTRNGIRVCQFYLKQCRVEISEEDYVLIRSGMPQKLIPPQPILEDEEKELGVIDVLDLSARARQVAHRIKNRRTAILARREAEGDVARNVLRSNDLPPSPAFEHNGVLPAAPEQPLQSRAPPVSSIPSPTMPSSGFTAVNTRHSLPPSEAQPFSMMREIHHDHQQEPVRRESAVREPISDGPSTHTPAQHHSHRMSDPKPTAAVGDDWMSKFLTPSERAAGLTVDQVRRENLTSPYRTTSRGETGPTIDDSNRMSSMPPTKQETRRQSEGTLPEKAVSVASTEGQGPSVPIPNTPASLMPQQKPQNWIRDDGGPHKAEMISRMETMKRGERVIPPCDRCRRLHMDCTKNLTACLGCTKKHAKCSWKDVSMDELESTAPAAREREKEQDNIVATTASDWDNMLKYNKPDQLEQGRTSPSSSSVPTAEAALDISSNKASTPRMHSPPQNGIARSSNHLQESPRLDVRPPPLEQQLRDATEDRTHQLGATSRFSPFPRPFSQHQYSNQLKDESADTGDRLAAIANQVYRSASQNTNRYGMLITTFGDTVYAIAGKVIFSKQSD